MKPTDYPVLNEKLFDCICGYLEEHPEQHNQNNWLLLRTLGLEENFCGTVGCIAGWACLLTVPEDKSWKSIDNILGGNSSWQSAGAAKLGLDTYESSFLFAGTDYAGKNQLIEIKRRWSVLKQARKEGRHPVELSNTK